MRSAGCAHGGPRISGTHASGTTIKNTNNHDIGKGNALGAAANVVLRPLLSTARVSEFTLVRLMIRTQ